MALNLPSLSSSSRSCPSFSIPNSGCHVSGTSLTFQIPKKRAQVACHGRKCGVSVHPIKREELGYGFSSVATSNYGVVDSTKRPELVAKAAEVAASTTEEAAPSKPKSSKKGKGTKYPRRMIDMYQILKNPIITEAAIKNVADENSLLFTVDVRADKKMIRDAFNNFFGVKVRKVNTSIRPDGTKKAFIMLSKEYNASDIAKRIGIFPGSD